MKNSVTLIPHFENRFKRLAKKFKSLEGEVDALIDELTEKPTIGESLGAGLHKVRLARKSKGKGKRGGFQVITYLLTETKEGQEIFLITIYDKSEEGSIKKDVLQRLIHELLGE